MFDGITWLPELVYLESCNGVWEKYIEAVYNIFKGDFIDCSNNFQGKQLNVLKYPLIKGKESGFWHLVQEGPVESERIPDLRRCERINWPKVIIYNSIQCEVKIYENQRNTTRGVLKNICLWLEKEDYLIIIRKKNNCLLLWTAYILKYEHAKQKAKKEYEEYIKKQGTLGNQATPDIPSTTR